jgi:hypothetical protein
MAWAPDDILPRIVNAGDAGLTLGRMTKELAAPHRGKLAETLKSLLNAKEIRGPVKHGASQYYFAAERGPSADVTGSVVSKLAREAQMKLLSKTKLKEKVTGLNGKFLAGGIKRAVAKKEIIELICGTSKYYLHREVAQKFFALSEAATGDSPKLPPKEPSRAELTMQAVRPVYQRLRAQQGGLGTIDICDLMKALGVPKDVLHQFLMKEMKAGRLTIHPTTTIQLRPEVIDAGVRIDGHPEPYVTVALKDA